MLDTIKNSCHCVNFDNLIGLFLSDNRNDMYDGGSNRNERASFE